MRGSVPTPSDSGESLPALPLIRSSALFDDSLVLGALDSLGVALAEHGHEWTTGERAIYEEAVGILTWRVGCMDSGSVDSVKHPSLMPCSELRQVSCRASVRLLALEYSLWRVVLAAGHLAMTKLFRCCVWIYSYRAMSSNDPSSATAATRRTDCNYDGPPPFAAAPG
jgi:hypothetical protein